MRKSVALVHLSVVFLAVSACQTTDAPVDDPTASPGEPEASAVTETAAIPELDPTSFAVPVFDLPDGLTEAPGQDFPNALACSAC
jgi:hypothetical protein